MRVNKVKGKFEGMAYGMNRGNFLGLTEKFFYRAPTKETESFKWFVMFLKHS